MIKRRSISRRVYHAILAVSVISMFAMVVTVLLVNEDLENTMLEVEFAQERDFILMHRPKDEVLVWDTHNMAVVFIPEGEPLPANMPKIFLGLPDHYSNEVDIGDSTYLITVGPADQGRLYVAKDITHFEDRESLFETALGIMTLVIVALSLLLAVFSSRRIVRPLRRLAGQISRIPVGSSMPRMDTDYADAELHSIVTTFNRFLDELESYVRREQSLLSLASHELKISHDAGDRVSLATPADLCVDTDPAMLRMLLRNLIQNALQHTKGAIHVTLAPGLIEIEDQGSGLSSEQQTILRDGKRLPSTKTSVSGLGLYIVTLMCERLDWPLTIAQTDSSGTRIRLEPPLVRPDRPEI